MRTKEIIQSFVGTSKIVLKDVYTDAETNAIVIKARPTKMNNAAVDCAIGRASTTTRDKASVGGELWI